MCLCYYKCLISFTYLQTTCINSQIKRYQPGINAQTSNHRTGEAEAVGSLPLPLCLYGQPGLQTEFLDSQGSKKWGGGGGGHVSNSIKFDKWMARNGETLKGTSNGT